MLDISIIIPIYNVEKYLRECLDSVRKVAEKLNVEVIMIDDGSTDESSNIAKEYAEKYTEFSYNRQENKGLGNARNYGASLASGGYIWFVDSDDLVDADVICRMFELAKRTQSELTICDAARIKDKKVTAADNFLYSFHNLTDVVTHITKHPALVYDTMAWNKLILRSYYQKHRFTFPEEYLYEDIPWAIPLHYYANQVAVLNEVGYYWRVRTGDSRSITQQKDQKKNLTDKIAMFQRTFDFLNQCVNIEEIHTMMEVRQWGFDYVGYLNLLQDMDEDTAREYVAILSEYMERNMTEKGYGSLPLIHQQIVHDILRQDLEHLIRVNNYRKINYQNVPILENGNEKELLVSDEIFTISNRSAANEFRGRPSRCALDDVVIQEQKLMLEGHIYNRKISIAEGMQQVKTFLRHSVSGTCYTLSSYACLCRWLTEAQGTVTNYDDYRNYHCNYDGTGFKIEMDFAELEKLDLETGLYHLFVEQKNPIVSNVRTLRGAKKQAQSIVDKFVYQGERQEFAIHIDRRETFQLFVSERAAETNEEEPVKVQEDMKEKETIWNRIFTRRN